ncbi:response regulator [Pilimelia columellifera]|uniref:Response regulatory domain-containing protein n=1 Tax=Pilimelia columellifera subsp. columellifera TaxID=706583 RepID=A0ABN3N3H5_9ACTN
MTGRQVLLVEDEELNRVLVRASLARATDPAVKEIQLVEAATLATARAALAGDPPDVVLLDLNLPDGNGLTLATELSSRDDYSRPEVVALTASVLPAERAAAMAAGCDGFLDKPYVAADLVAILAAHLKRRQDRPSG